MQTAYAVIDVAIVALLIRLFASNPPWSRSLALLFASFVGLLLSDAVWNWSVQLGTYTPATWADVGWLVFSATAGAAALHPSMAAVSAAARPVRRRFRWDRVVLLGAASLVAPVLLALETATGEADHLAAIALAGRRSDSSSSRDSSPSCATRRSSVGSWRFSTSGCARRRR